MKAFVTGSTGLLGSNLVNALVAAGHEVKALARSREKAERLLPQAHVEIVVGDMENIPAFAPSMAGSDVLFHTAAYVREVFGPGNHWPKLEKINVQGTLELLTQAETHGVKTAIHTSSTGVLGIRSDGTPGDERTPPDNFVQGDPYTRSKLLAEQAIADFLTSHRLRVILVLPSALFGPQDSGPSATGQAIIQVLERKLPILPPGGVSMVDARDVATAMITAAERGQSGERYIVSNGYVTLERLAQMVGQVAGVPIPTRRIPYRVLNLLAHAGELVSRVTGAPPAMSVNALKALNRKHEVLAAKAMRELGVTFRPFEETIRDTVNWFLANAYVHSSERVL
ncbi:MAG TPA: SDR family oxidoreductase [Ktedonobacterales bacterium]|nr:SDR family oxidoreductase [Ktedonobacterales bacterium]